MFRQLLTYTAIATLTLGTAGVAQAAESYDAEVTPYSKTHPDVGIYGARADNDFPRGTFVDMQRPQTGQQQLAAKTSDEPVKQTTKAPEKVTVYFDFDKATLRDSAGRKIDSFSDRLALQGGETLEVNGHTDRAGPRAYNQELSQDRAERVAMALQKEGISASNMELNWYGESRPKVETKDGVRLQANRRVVVETQ